MAKAHTGFVDIEREFNNDNLKKKIRNTGRNKKNNI